MKIHSVEYAGTVAAPGGPKPGDFPQVAFSGRSNVGKSSLINVLLRRTRNRIAHVSGQPGKTQALNFYLVNDHFYLVDLPGFGYAKVSQGMRDAWRRLIEHYLSTEDKLVGVVHLVDSRRAPTPQDEEMVAYLAELGHPTLVVLTKMDKLKRKDRAAAVSRACASLGLEEDQVVPFSSKTGEGREALLEALSSLLAMESPVTEMEVS
ncbi:MAG: ribosome biogenesis GTP-binding protein YihA/YsxC [Gemmatimonadota bacterium]|nr:ribosome biogenesis GTP-binding protein YihA/YsxC [Gemmatimonadota bacterium]MDH5758855.1 ribosome biogenesis GTP-binding protein YihA/YsxC [Gemmatimonadota bacterium]